MLEAVDTLSAKWDTLAIKLRLREHTIKAIQKVNPKDVDVCLSKALEQWLKLNYAYRKYGRPSWRILVKSVQELDQNLFEKIARKHPGERNARMCHCYNSYSHTNL